MIRLIDQSKWSFERKVRNRTVRWLIVGWSHRPIKLERSDFIRMKEVIPSYLKKKLWSPSKFGEQHFLRRVVEVFGESSQSGFLLADHHFAEKIKFSLKIFKILPCQDWVSFPVEVDWWHLIGPLKLVSFDLHIYKSCLDLFERLPIPTVHLLPVWPSKTSQSL